MKKICSHCNNYGKEGKGLCMKRLEMRFKLQTLSAGTMQSFSVPFL